MHEGIKKHFVRSFRIISGVMPVETYEIYEADRNKKYGNRGWLLSTEPHVVNDKNNVIVYVYPVEGEYLSKVATDIKTIRLSEMNI